MLFRNVTRRLYFKEICSAYMVYIALFVRLKFYYYGLKTYHQPSRLRLRPGVWFINTNV